MVAEVLFGLVWVGQGFFVVDFWVEGFWGVGRTCAFGFFLV